MKQIFAHFSFIAVLMAVLWIGPSGCSDSSDLYDQLPVPVAKFVTQYFPGYGIDSYTDTTDGCHVRLDNGPGLTFDAQYQWLSINGYGMPLPKVLMFDQLPPKLYMYLQETENADNVYSVERDGFRYTLHLLSATLVYEISTGRISGTDAVEQSRALRGLHQSWVSHSGRRP